MKISKLLFIAFGILLFASCKDDDKPVDLIVGSWDLSLISYTECVDPFDNYSQIFGDAGCEVESEGTWCATSNITFTAPSTAVVVNELTLDGVIDPSESETLNGTYSFSETNENEMTVCFSGDCTMLTMSFSGSNMTGIGMIDDCTITMMGSK